MKAKVLIAFLLLAVTASAATKVKTQRFVVKDSIRLIDESEPNEPGYKFIKTATVNWPVTINGKKSNALTKFLLDSVFGANQNRDIYPYYPSDVKVISDFVTDGVYRALRDHSMAKEYRIYEVGSPGIPDINRSENPMSCWTEDVVLDYSHSYGDLAFFTAYYDDYYGGAHNMFATSYHAFDAKLDKPIFLKDIVTSPKKVLRMLPRYDDRDAESKWWQNIDVDDIDNFYIKNGKMVFVFAPYSVGPFCDGEVEVPILLKTLNAKGLLTSYGKKLLTIKK